MLIIEEIQLFKETSILPYDLIYRRLVPLYPGSGASPAGQILAPHLTKMPLLMYIEIYDPALKYLILLLGNEVILN